MWSMCWTENPKMSVWFTPCPPYYMKGVTIMSSSIWDLAKQIEDKFYEIESLKSSMQMFVSNKQEAEKIVEIAQNNAKIRRNRENNQYDR